MAVIRWGTNTNGSDITANGNWLGGVAPGGADDAVFDGEFTGSCIDGAAPLAPANCYVDPAYTAGTGTAEMGTVATPVRINATDILSFGGGADAWITTTTNQVLCTARNTSNTLTITPTISGTEDTMNVASGKVVIAGGTIQNLHIARAILGTSEPIVTIQSAATISNALCMAGGNVTNQITSFGATLSVTGGNLEMQGTTNSPTITFISGGRVRFTGTTTLTLNEFYIGPQGTLDISGHKGSFALGTTTILVVFPQGFANMDSNKAIGWDGNATAIVFRGGQLKQFVNDINPIMV